MTTPESEPAEPAGDPESPPKGRPFDAPEINVPMSYPVPVRDKPRLTIISPNIKTMMPEVFKILEVIFEEMKEAKYANPNMTGNVPKAKTNKNFAPSIG